MCCEERAIHDATTHFIHSRHAEWRDATIQDTAIISSSSTTFPRTAQNFPLERSWAKLHCGHHTGSTLASYLQQQNLGSIFRSEKSSLNIFTTLWKWLARRMRKAHQSRQTCQSLCKTRKQLRHTHTHTHTRTHTLLLRIAFRLVKLERALRAKHSSSKQGARSAGRSWVSVAHKLYSAMWICSQGIVVGEQV